MLADHRQACWQEDRGQAMLEYILVLSAVALPLMLAARHMQDEMVAFLQHIIKTMALWPIGT